MLVDLLFKAKAVIHGVFDPFGAHENLPPLLSRNDPAILI
jgi:hypothetical protein